MNWPTSTDYTSAVQVPESAFLSTKLASSKPVTNAMGIPTAATGQNAVVFLIEDDVKVKHALRCFTSAPTEGKMRYHALTEHLARLGEPTGIAEATWIDDGIVLQGRTWPVVLMPWIADRRLDVFVEDQLESDPRSLETLANSIYGTVVGLQAKGIAHGDLQHGNVLVSPTLTISLVDLDGVWVSSTACPTPHELGHPNYQHPGRNAASWGPFIDSFSTLLIDLSLRALASDPSLSDALTGENLVIRRSDLLDKEAPIWGRLVSNPDERVTWGAQRLQELAQGPVEASLRPVADLFGSSELVQVSNPAPQTVVAQPVQSSEDSWWDQTPTSGGAASTVRAFPPPGHGPNAVPPQPVVNQGPSSSGSFLYSGPVGSAIGGAAAGIVGCLFFGVIEKAVHHNFRAGVFMALVAGLIGAAVLGWNGLTSGNSGRAARQGLIGFGVAAVAAVVALPLADLILSGPIEQVKIDEAARTGISVNDVRSADAPVVAVALAWAAVAAVVGFALGLWQSRRAAMLGLVAGLVTGLFGGLLHASTAASVFRDRLVIEPLNPSTILATTVVASLIGLAVATARRTGALAVLTVIEGRMAGAEVLLKDSNNIGSLPSSTLVLEGRGLLPDHATLQVRNGMGLLTANGPVQVQGNDYPGDPSVAHPLQSGDVFRVGSSYVRFTQNASG